MDYKETTIYISTYLSKQLDAAADMLTCSQSEVIERLIRSHVPYVIKADVKGYRKQLDEDFTDFVDWLNRSNDPIYGYAED